MQKLFTLIAALVATLSVSAQGLCFCDSEGNVYEDGATLTVTTAVYDEDWEQWMVPLSNLYIKNASEDAIDGVLNVTIDKFEGSGFQCCFGTNCRNLSKAGTMTIKPVVVDPGKWTEITNTEWVPNEGEYTSLTTKFEIGDGMETMATLNIVFVFDDPAGIKDLTPALSQGEGVVYNAAGQQVSSNYKGLVIKNGRKFLVK